MQVCVALAPLVSVLDQSALNHLILAEGFLEVIEEEVDDLVFGCFEVEV